MTEAANTVQQGWRILMDLNNKREYAIKYKDGKPLVTSAGNLMLVMYAPKGTSGKIKPHETIVAIDVTQYRTYNETTDIATFTVNAVKLQADQNGFIRLETLQDTQLDYDVVINEEDARVDYHLSPASAYALKQAEFDGVPDHFYKDLSEEIDLKYPDVLGSLSFPPHHPYTGGNIAMQVYNKDGLTAEFASSAVAVNDDGTVFKISDKELKEALTAHGEDLTAQLSATEAKELHGRDDLIHQTVAVLNQKKFGNALVAAEDGAGKSSIVKGIVEYFKYNQDALPENLQNVRFLRLNMELMNTKAETPYGVSQQYLPIFEGLRERGGKLNGQKIILILENLSSQLDAMPTPDDALVRDYLNTKGVSVIATATPKQEKRLKARYGEIVSRFTPVVVTAPTQENLIKMVKDKAEEIAQHYGLEQRPTMRDIEYAAQLTSRYVKVGTQPAKTLQALHMAASAIQTEYLRNGGTLNYITRERLEAAVGSMRGKKIAIETDSSLAARLTETLQKEIIGQEAVNLLIDSILGAHSGLRDTSKPLGVYLLPGPTGVGKTETAKVTAKILDVPLIRFDMSEYMEKHNAQKLIGSPAGYIGHDEGGLLTNQISANPNCVLLLDEIDKAHPDVLNTFMQVYDHGHLTDNKGHQVDFTNTTIFMTSNEGADKVLAQLKGGKASIGFTQEKAITDNSITALQKLYAEKLSTANGGTLRPEFIGRIDAILPYTHLTEQNVEALIDKQVTVINARLQDQAGSNLPQLTLVFAEAVKKQLAKEGHTPTEGVRGLQRLIKNKIENPLGRWKMENAAAIKAFIAEHGQGQVVVSGLGAEFKVELVPTTPKPQTAAVVVNKNIPVLHRSKPKTLDAGSKA